jgi:predicted transcriptional regulator
MKSTAERVSTQRERRIADRFVIRELTVDELLEEARTEKRVSSALPLPRSERRMNILEPGAMAGFLSPQRVALLQFLARSGGAAMTELSAALDRAKTAVARDVATMEKFGLLQTELVVNPGHGRVTMVTPLARRYEFVWSIGAPARKIAAKSSAKKGKRKAA